MAAGSTMTPSPGNLFAGTILSNGPFVWNMEEDWNLSVYSGDDLLTPLARLALKGRAAPGTRELRFMEFTPEGFEFHADNGRGDIELALEAAFSSGPVDRIEMDEKGKVTFYSGDKPVYTLEGKDAAEVEDGFFRFTAHKPSKPKAAAPPAPVADGSSVTPKPGNLFTGTIVFNGNFVFNVEEDWNLSVYSGDDLLSPLARLALKARAAPGTRELRFMEFVPEGFKFHADDGCGDIELALEAAFLGGPVDRIEMDAEGKVTFVSGDKVVYTLEGEDAGAADDRFFRFTAHKPSKNKHGAVHDRH
ncbi:hypothetical protein DFJ74DRAFT_696521 [Hyaloraphidium curvatum]|nr:hypothetical protein DFJ74DRAFT_696521 [Hyaloraphidium curvatum]